MPFRVDYEWVVEVVDENGDITDCDYYDEVDLKKALAARKQQEVDNPRVDFGLCRHRAETFADGGDDEEADREYAYLDETGRLPAAMELGTKVPKRIQEMFEKVVPNG